jgi:AhpD family alkylhydroperoxidase
MPWREHIQGQAASGVGSTFFLPAILMSVLKYSPEMSRQVMPLFHDVRHASSLPQKVRELAMLTTARAKDCPSIWNAHAALGRQAGLRDDVVDALRDRTPLPPMAMEEAVVIKLGMEFFQTNRVSQDTFDVALAQFGLQGLGGTDHLDGVLRHAGLQRQRRRPGIAARAHRAAVAGLTGDIPIWWVVPVASAGGEVPGG